MDLVFFPHISRAEALIGEAGSTKKKFRMSKTKNFSKSSEKMGFHWFQPQLQPSSISIRKNRKQLGIRRLRTTMTGERIVYPGTRPHYSHATPVLAYMANFRILEKP